MKILYAITAYPPAVGGAQIHAHCMAKAVQGLGHDVRVVCHWSNDRRDWIRGSTVFSGPGRVREQEGIEVHELGFGLPARMAMVPWAAAYPLMPGLSTWAIAEVIRPYFLHAAGEPSLVHVSRIGREFLARTALNFARRKDIPFVLTPNHHPKWHGWLYREYDRIYRAADAVIALTQEEKRLLVSEKGVADHRVHVRAIGPVLSETYSAEDFRARCGLGDAPFVLYLGQQYEYKGCGALLDAAEQVWKHYPDWRFVFVGPHTDYSRKRFAEVTDERVLNLGAVDLDTKTSALAACNFMCLPSAQESFGGVYVEAWAMGKAVIGGRIPPIACVVEEGRDGVLSSQAPGELAEALEALMNDTARCAAMGAAGKRKVDEKYSWDYLAGRNAELYARLYAGKP